MASVAVAAKVKAINDVCRAKGGVYARYSCKSVSWDDVARDTFQSQLSCYGANITDTRLWAKDGRQLFTVRSDNWDEKLGCVSTNDVAVLAGVHGPGDDINMQSLTLRDLLASFGTFGKYAGVPGTTDLSNEALDAKVSIRFQTTFLPIAQDEDATLEFCSEAYNYNSKTDDDPRNLVLLCTSQGLAVQQDGVGAKRLFHRC
jgi:huntingtin